MNTTAGAWSNSASKYSCYGTDRLKVRRNTRSKLDPGAALEELLWVTRFGGSKCTNGAKDVAVGKTPEPTLELGAINDGASTCVVFGGQNVAFPLMKD